MSGTRCNATSACPISTVRTGSASCHRNRISRCSLTESASTNFDAHSPAPQSRKVDVSPTHFVHPQSCPPTTLNQTFSHHKAERSGSDQLFLSFNPAAAHGTRQHILEGAGHKADPFEYPINTVQVFRCAPFLGSPFVGVALGLMTINVRTPPVGTIERTWQFPVNFSPLRPGARPCAHVR